MNIQFLSVEIYYQIFSLFDAKTLVTCERVSKYWKEIATQDSLWRVLCVQIGIENKNDTSWKITYINSYEPARYRKNVVLTL